MLVKRVSKQNDVYQRRNMFGSWQDSWAHSDEVPINEFEELSGNFVSGETRHNALTHPSEYTTRKLYYPFTVRYMHDGNFDINKWVSNTAVYENRLISAVF